MTHGVIRRQCTTSALYGSDKRLNMLRSSISVIVNPDGRPCFRLSVLPRLHHSRAVIALFRILSLAGIYSNLGCGCLSSKEAVYTSIITVGYHAIFGPYLRFDSRQRGRTDLWTNYHNHSHKIIDYDTYEVINNDISCRRFKYHQCVPISQYCTPVCTM